MLAERFFGSALELTSHDNYCPFWASDAQDPHSRPVGSEDGESVVQVSQRVHQLFQVCVEPVMAQLPCAASVPLVPQLVSSGEALRVAHWPVVPCCNVCWASTEQAYMITHVYSAFQTMLPMFPWPLKGSFFSM